MDVGSALLRDGINDFGLGENVCANISLKFHHGPESIGQNDTAIFLNFGWLSKKLR